jgi:hypothetical protein
MSPITMDILSVQEQLQPQGNILANPGGGVMMQAFIGMSQQGNWWNTLSTKVTAWSNAGIGSICLPPVSKAQNGPFSMDMTLRITLILEIITKMVLQKLVSVLKLN